MKYFLMMLSFLGMMSNVVAQEYSVRGKVTDFHNKSNLVGAIIQVGDAETKSDEQGVFSMTLKSGKYTLKVSHPDCDSYTETIKVNSNLDLKISLEHHIDEIEEVHLYSVHKKKGSMIVNTLKSEDISRNSNESLGNILTNISGLSAIKTGNNISKPVIHGLYGSRISVINNGVKMAEQEWGVEHAPNVDVNAFDHIDVIKGASALKYGNEGVSGVVVLEPSIIPKKDTLFGKVALSGISSGRGGSVQASATKAWENQWFVSANGSFKKLGDIYTPDGTAQNTGAEVRSFNFSFGKRTFLQGFDVSYSGIQQEFGIFRGSHLGSPEDFYNAITNGGSQYFGDFSYDILSPKQDVEHHIFKTSAYKRFENFGKLSLQYSLQYNRRKEYDIRRGENNNLPSMDLRLITQNVQLTHLIERNSWKWESGLSGSIQDNYPNPDTKARRLIPDYYRYDLGAFSVFQYHLNPKWMFEVSARYDFSRYDAYKYYDASVWNDSYAALFPAFFVSEHDSRILTRPLMNFHNFSANLGLNYQPFDVLKLKFNASKVNRTPNASELFADGLHHSASIIELGNLALKQENIYQFNVNAQVKLDVLNGFNLELNPYWMTSENFINQVPVGVQNSNRGVFPIWQYQQIAADIYGLDVDASLDFTDQLKWKGQFSTLRGKDRTNQEDLILMMPSNMKNALEYAPKFKNFYVRLENETVWQQKNFPVRNFNVDFIENGNLVSKEVDYSTPPAGYTLFHISAGMDLVKNVNLNFKIQNLFNKNYRDYLNRIRFFAPEQGRNLVLTLQFKF